MSLSFFWPCRKREKKWKTDSFCAYQYYCKCASGTCTNSSHIVFVFLFSALFHMLYIVPLPWLKSHLLDSVDFGGIHLRAEQLVAEVFQRRGAILFGGRQFWGVEVWDIKKYSLQAKLRRGSFSACGFTNEFSIISTWSKSRYFTSARLIRCWSIKAWTFSLSGMTSAPILEMRRRNAKHFGGKIRRKPNPKGAQASARRWGDRRP